MRWFASAQLRTYPVRCQGFDTAKNPKLHAVFPSGAVPDLRGKFIRGWAHGSTTDPDSGRTIGSDQDHGIPDHAHWAGIESYSRFDISHHRQETVREGKNQAVRSANRTNLSISPAPAVNIAPETRPKNLALMYIVTTDQTDNIKPDPTPTNIVVTPSSLNTGVGSTQQFTDQVLPADLAPSFPVTWISTNTAAGIIDGNGLFRAVGPGSTDIIASVSSGLSVRVTVRVDILLTSISLAVIPDQIAGKIQRLNTGTMRSVIPGCFQRGNRINDNTRAMPRSERD